MASKKIVFKIVGNEDSVCKTASYGEESIKRWFASDKDKANFHIEEAIVDVDKAHTLALSKLDGVDKLMILTSRGSTRNG